MTKQSKANKKGKKVAKSSRPTGKNKNPPKAKVHLSEYTRLLASPCNGPLVTSVGGSQGTGIVSRVRSIYTNASTDGYLIWYPAYHGVSVFDTALNPYNIFVYEGVSATPPTNTVADPMGRGAAATSVRGRFICDPAAALLAAGSSFSRAKSIAACITTEYSGSVSACAGTIARISNISMSSFMPVSAGAAIPLSTDQMYAYAANRGRIIIEGQEVRWRPTDESSVLRDIGYDGAGGVQTTSPDTCWWAGAASTDYTRISGTDLVQATAIAICWKGVPAGTLNLQLTKVVELELSARTNMLEEISVPSSTVVPGGLKKITDTLDQVAPGWQTAALNAAHSAASQLARNALNAFTMPSQLLLRDL